MMQLIATSTKQRTEGKRFRETKVERIEPDSASTKRPLMNSWVNLMLISGISNPSSIFPFVSLPMSNEREREREVEG
jgi:hypothetical protein